MFHFHAVTLSLLSLEVAQTLVPVWTGQGMFGNPNQLGVNGPEININILLEVHCAIIKNYI